MSEPTTAEEREEWATTDWCPDEEPCYPDKDAPVWKDGITLCTNEVIRRLIADVGRLEGELGQAREHGGRLSSCLARAERHEGELGQENTRLREALATFFCSCEISKDYCRAHMADQAFWRIANQWTDGKYKERTIAARAALRAPHA